MTLRARGEQARVALEVARRGAPSASGVDSWRQVRVTGLSQATMRLSGHALFLDIGQGVGLAAATGVRPFLPALLAGALARGDAGIDFEGTDFASWRAGFLLACWPLAVLVVRRTLGPEPARGRAARRASRRSAWCSARCCSPARSRTTATRAGRADRRGAAARRSAWLRASAACFARARAGSTGGAAALLTAYADGAGARRWPASRSSCRRSSFVRARASCVLLGAARRREGEKYAGLRILRSDARAQEARPRGHRLAQAGRCSTGRSSRAGRRRWRRSWSAAPTSRLRRRRSPRSRPSAPPHRHRLGPGRAPHPLDELVPPRRGALRRVRLVVREPTRAFGVVRSLYDTVYNMNMAHLSREAPTVFERLDDAGLRTAGTTYLIYRGRTAPRAVGRERVLARIAGRRSSATPSMGPRELFYADLFASRNTGCRSDARDARPARPAQRLRGRYLVEHDLFDFLLFSLPDNDTYSHKRGPVRAGRLDRRGRPRARADRCTRPAASTRSSRSTR